MVHASFFYEHGKGFKPFIVGLGIFISFIFQQFHYSFCEESSQFGNEGTILIGLSWNIERNVLAIDNSFYESESMRKKNFLAFFFDQYLFGI